MIHIGNVKYEEGNEHEMDWKMMHGRSGGIDSKIANASQYPRRDVTMDSDLELSISCPQISGVFSIHLYLAPPGGS